MAPAAAVEPESALDGTLRIWRLAAAEREERFLEALHPGRTADLRARRLAHATLDDLRDEGERLFSLDAPWDDRPAPTVRPLHAKAGPPTADATRCLGCHHVGGDGGGGRFGDLAYFDGEGDDLLSARAHLPRMLAGAALLERAADGRGDLHPFGWAPGRPRRLRDMVRWSIETHLGAAPRDDDLDALTTYIALLPPPVEVRPRRDSLVTRAARGAELLAEIGCTGCHVERLPVADPVLGLARGRRIDLARLLSSDGRPPFAVRAFTDLRPHRVAGDEPFVTASLWGVASRGPYLHDGRAATLEEAILAHGGEAAKSRDAFVALGGEQSALLLFLATLERPAVMSWVR